MSDKNLKSTDDKDEILSQFLMFTGTEDPSRASSYLEMSGGNLETAVSLYMDHAHSGVSNGFSASSSSTSALPSSSESATNFDPSSVRAPDEVQTMRLMPLEEPGIMGMGQMNRHDGVMSSVFPAEDGLNPFYDIREVVNAAAAASEEKSGEDMDDDEEVVEMSSGSRKMSALSDMYAPPHHLIHKGGGFQGARSVAKDARRWLLVNLQSDSDFACHALNRDVWRDELVENLVRMGFIFWQQMDTSADGTTYAHRYNVQAFPHLAILDPRTGRLMWRKEGWSQVNPMTAEMFAEVAADFCSHHSFDKPPTAPRQSASSPRAKRPIQELSEEEQLQAAIRASMVEDLTNEDSNDVDQAESDHSDIISADRKEEITPPAIAKPKSFHDQILEIPVGTEPESGARVQIRMPDGGRIVRKFNDFDEVKVIYAFVAQSNDEAKEGKSFQLRAGFPPADLWDKVNSTIKSCCLSGESITVRWK